MTRNPERGRSRTDAPEQIRGGFVASALLCCVLMTGTALAAPGRADSQAIPSAATRGENWPAYGLDPAETRHSPLSEISADNVGRLGLVWSYNLESTRGVEATPLVVDGIMYVTASWSVVHAVDVRTGKRLWS